MITEEQFNAKKREYDNMTQEQREKLSKNWEIFQTKKDFCPNQDRENHPPGHLSNSIFCTKGSATGWCTFSGCPMQSEVLKLEEK